MEQKNNTEYKVGYKKPPLGIEWKPGQSGNPAGRPRNSLTTLLERYLEADNASEKQQLVEELVKLAKTNQGRGQIPALKEIFERIDGKVADKHLNVNVLVTPESLQVAQERLLNAQEDTKRLLEKYPKQTNNVPSAT